MASGISTKRNASVNITGRSSGIIATGKITTFDGSDAVTINGVTPDCIILCGREVNDSTPASLDDLIAVPTLNTITFTATATGGTGTITFVVIKP